MHRLWNESFMVVHFVSRVYLALRLKTTTNHNNCLSITNTIICLALTRSNNWKRSFYSCRSVCVLHIWPADERVNMLLYTDLVCHLLEYNYIKTDKNHQYSCFSKKKSLRSFWMEPRKKMFMKVIWLAVYFLFYFWNTSA